MPPSRVCLTFDFDALSVWLGYDHVTPAMLQRGEYGARVGVPRLLERLAALRLPATFFIPGHTIESFPAECEAILEEFDWMHRHVDGGLLAVCMHPQVIGRGHRMAMLERFVEHCAAAGAQFASMGDVAGELG